jgi:hypothetical protein
MRHEHSPCDFRGRSHLKQIVLKFRERKTVFLCFLCSLLFKPVHELPGCTDTVPGSSPATTIRYLLCLKRKARPSRCRKVAVGAAFHDGRARALYNSPRR